MGYLGLFLSAFLAATLLPAASEVALGSLVVSGEYSLPALWACATLGNTLGSVVNAALGRGLARFESARWFPFTPEQVARAETRFRRYGVWTLLLAWLPVVGDPLTLVAGVLRVPWPLFLALVALGKGMRYAVVIAVTLGVSA